jgi:arginase
VTIATPSALGHVPEQLGVERVPEALLGAGLADGLAGRRAGRVEAAGYSADRDSGTQVMNPQAIRDYSPLLAYAVTAVLDQGEFSVVLGGDCSIVPGTMLPLRRRGRYPGPGHDVPLPQLHHCRAARRSVALILRAHCPGVRSRYRASSRQ